MLLFTDINRDGIKSEFLDVLDENEDDSPVQIPSQFSNDTIQSFNNRIITPKNINEIISFCDFLLMEDVLKFICDYSVVTEEKYILNVWHRQHYKLPSYMCSTNIIFCAKYDNLRWLRGKIKSPKDFHVGMYIWAIKNKNMDMIRYLYRNKCPQTELIINTGTIILEDKSHLKGKTLTCFCAEFDNLECLKYFLERDFDSNIGSVMNKASYYSLECYEYLCDNDNEISICHINNALTKNKIDIVKYILKRKTFIEPLINKIAKYKYMDMLKLLLENNYTISNTGRFFIYDSDNIEFMKYLGIESFPNILNEIHIILRYDSINIIKYLIEDIGIIDARRCYECFWYYKNLKVCEYLCKFASQVPKVLVLKQVIRMYEKCNIDCMKMMIDNNVEFIFDKKTPMYSTKENIKEMRKLLRQNGRYQNVFIHDVPSSVQTR